MRRPVPRVPASARVRSLATALLIGPHIALLPGPARIALLTFALGLLLPLLSALLAALLAAALLTALAGLLLLLARLLAAALLLTALLFLVRIALILILIGHRTLHGVAPAQHNVRTQRRVPGTRPALNALPKFQIGFDASGTRQTCLYSRS